MKQTVEEAARTHWNESTYNKDAELAYDERDCIAIKALAKAIALRAFKKGADWQAKQSPWIKVKDQLPPVDENEVSMQSDRVLVQPSSKEWFEPEILIYNKYYHVWDSEDGDDYEYEISDDDLWMPIPSFDEILEANRDVLERIKEKGD